MRVVPAFDPFGYRHFGQDGTTHIVMAPLEFMQRLAALVSRPRLHLIRFHGVLAQRQAASRHYPERLHRCERGRS